MTQALVQFSCSMLICFFYYKVIPNLKHTCNEIWHCYMCRNIWWLCLSAHDKPIVEKNSFQHTLSFVKAIFLMTYPYSTFVEFAAFLQSQVREKSSPSGIILAIYVDSEKPHAIFNSPKRVYASFNARWKTSWYCILRQYVFGKGQICNNIEFLFLQKKMF